MSITLRLAAIVACLFAVCSFSHSAHAQGSGTSVAVLDVGKVFKDCLRFAQAMEVMKDDVTKFENYLRDERTKVQEMVDGLKGFNNGSKEYNELEARIAKITSNLQVETKLKQKEFMQREAKLYFNTYTEMTKVVTDFATEYQIDLVLRFSSEEIQQDNPQTILQGVNASIVYHRNRDITRKIIEIMNRGSATSDTRGARPPVPGQPR